MRTRPQGTVIQHIQHTEAGVIAREPSAASVVEGQMPVSGGAISYTKAGTGPAVLLIHGRMLALTLVADWAGRSRDGIRVPAQPKAVERV